MSSTITKLVTADELLAMPDDGYCYELLKGELIRMPPPWHEHGRVAMRIAGPLYQHVMDNNLGEVYAAETGFLIQCEPDTVRSPDSAFITRERLEAAGDIKGYFPGAPDLCVEVLSSSDSIGYVEQKVSDWLARIANGLGCESKVKDGYRLSIAYRIYTFGERCLGWRRCSAWLSVSDRKDICHES